MLHHTSGPNVSWHPQNRIHRVTRFYSDTTEVFLITNHIIFAAAWWFGTLGITRML